MTTAKAPAGGLVSPINGQFYNGGEFIPDTGLYCGKGKNRVTRAAFDAVAEKAATRGWTLEFSEKYDRFRVLLPTGLSMFSATNLATLDKVLSS